MKFTMKKPCPKCPFRIDCTPAWLGKERAKEIIDAIFENDETFSCHKTNDFDDEGDTIETNKSEHCVGAMVLLNNYKRANQLMRIAERLNLLKINTVTTKENKSIIFKTKNDFIKHHTYDRRRI